MLTVGRQAFSSFPAAGMRMVGVRMFTQMISMHAVFRLAVLAAFLAFAGGRTAAGAGAPEEETTPSVLILNSYHHGYEWSDNEIEGALKCLQAAFPQVAPMIEHLDLKRLPAEAYRRGLAGFLAEKYRGRNIDLALVFDNPAFDLILPRRAEIIPGVPVVFAGINHFLPEMVAGLSGITGVAEVQDHAGTLALALALHPDARRVLAVHDYTVSGLAVRKEMEAVIPLFQDRVEIRFNAPATYEELAAQIAGLPPDGLVLVLSFATDRAGKTLGPGLSTEALTGQARVPVYATHETRLGRGIVGGLLIEGAAHGRLAAELALRVLAGEDAGSIPVAARGTSLPMFDYRQLRRFHVPLEALPDGSIIVNRPVTYYDRHKSILWGAAAVVGVLLSLIGLLAVALQRKSRVERALHASEDRFRLLFEKAPLPYQSLDEDGCLIEVNQNFLETLGYRREEVIGRNFAEFLLPEWKAHFKEKFPLLKAVGEILGVEFEMVRKDGSSLLVAFDGKIDRDNAGRFRRTHCVFTDVTARRQAEQELKSQRDTLSAIFESTPYLLMLVDSDMRIDSINRMGAASLGLSREQAGGMLCGEAFACLNASSGSGCGLSDLCRTCPVRTQVTRTFETGETVVNAEGRLRTCRGPEEKTQEFLISTARVRAGENDRVLVTLIDISEIKRTERALRESEANLSRLVENAPDAIYVQGGGRIRYANPAAVKLFGATSAAELLGRPMLDLVHPDCRESVAARMQALDARQSVPLASHTYLRRDGRAVDVEVSAVALHYRDGDGALVFARDVTEQRAMETRLVQAQKMEAIGTLAGGIAHDFNNILGVIVGNAEILDFSEGFSDAGRQSLKQILAASRRAKDLVRQILAFSRHSRQEKLLISLKPVLKETLGFLRASLPTSIELQHVIAADAGSVVADPTQIQQVVMNLCANAGQAMEEDGGVLRIELGNAALGEQDVRADPEAEPGDFVVLTVADTGRGMEPGVLERIFEPFFTTKGPEKGTGLGLSVVHGIVKSHGGIIRVYSEPGRGTTFKVFLPRAEGGEEFETVSGRPMPVGSERILLVDDERTLAELGHQMLSELGYRVETRTAPLEALAAFKAAPEKYDLVITDLAMPQMTGLKLARRLAEIRPDVPIILCSGFSDQTDEANARAIGVRAFLFKPLLMRELAEAVRQALDSSRRS